MSKKLINFVDISKSYGNNLVLDDFKILRRSRRIR